MKNSIKILIMDVDGTLTDGKIYMGEHGEVFKVFDIKDGFGIHDLLIPSGIRPIIMTGRESIILEKRCKELGMEKPYQGIKDKLHKLDEILYAMNHLEINVGMDMGHNGEYALYNYENVAYIGDDINDLQCMRSIKLAGGIIGCPCDAVFQVKEIADFVSGKNGGCGAVREFIEWLLFERE